MCILNTYDTYSISVANTIVYCPLMDFEISLSYISFFIPCGNEFGKLIFISFTLHSLSTYTSMYSICCYLIMQCQRSPYSYSSGQNKVPIAE